jgi:hypothetical protein
LRVERCPLQVMISHPCSLQGPGFRSLGFGLDGFPGSGFRGQGSGVRVEGSKFRVQGSWFGIEGCNRPAPIVVGHSRGPVAREGR